MTDCAEKPPPVEDVLPKRRAKSQIVAAIFVGQCTTSDVEFCKQGDNATSELAGCCGGITKA